MSYLGQSEKLKVISPEDSDYNSEFFRDLVLYNSIYDLIDDGLFAEFNWWDSPAFLGNTENKQRSVLDATLPGSGNLPNA